MTRTHDTNRFITHGLPKFFINDIDLSSYVTDITYSSDHTGINTQFTVHTPSGVKIGVEDIRIGSTVNPTPEPIPMRLYCAECGKLHVDTDEWATRPHHTHACQECGNVWRPAVVDTVGVKFLPGFHA